MKEGSVMHKIKVDEYISVSIKIPVVMDAMEFKALMMKATKIFNVSNAMTETTRISGRGRPASGTKKGRGYNRLFTKEMTEDMRTLYENGEKTLRITEAINEKYSTNFTNKQVYNKVFNSIRQPTTRT